MHQSIFFCFFFLLERAEQLITGFGGEREKWAETTVNLEQKLKQLTGDILLAVGTIAYLGKKLLKKSYLGIDHFKMEPFETFHCHFLIFH